MPAPRPIIVEIARRLPWFLGWLAVWMIERETARAEALVKQIVEPIAALARRALYVPPPLPEWVQQGGLANMFGTQGMGQMALQQAMMNQHYSHLLYQQRPATSDMFGNMLGGLFSATPFR